MPYRKPRQDGYDYRCDKPSQQGRQRTYPICQNCRRMITGQVFTLSDGRKVCSVCRLTIEGC